MEREVVGAESLKAPFHSRQVLYSGKEFPRVSAVH